MADFNESLEDDFRGTMNSPSGSEQVFIMLSTRREASSALVSEVSTTA